MVKCSEPNCNGNIIKIGFRGYSGGTTYVCTKCGSSKTWEEFYNIE
jgi:hypothetical protein